jgi:hypothetical protein
VAAHAALTPSCLCRSTADKRPSGWIQGLVAGHYMQDRITNDGRLVTGSLQPAADTWERAPHVPMTAPAVPPISTEVADSLSQYNLTSTELGMHDGLAATTRCHDTVSRRRVQALERLADFLQSASNVTVLTGAGVSTGSATAEQLNSSLPALT